ncbi:peroxiredoxin family protein [Maribacter algicola]|uniref:Peroxiredoxin family protein n=1 Tax=Meishania litoralis TaxID=3434685 RepID=A0ACC7LLM4_9FLAO
MPRKLLYLFILVLASCGKEEKKSPGVFFAGEIVNPTNDYVVLYKGDVVIDSAKLDDSNRFTFNLDSISNGLYHFFHPGEYQYLYLEQGDSLMARLNTTDFDESLVFSGIGEEINNYLINLYLLNEEEERDLFSIYYPMEPKDFERRMDSLRNLKLKTLKQLTSEADLSEEARDIAQANIDYTYYNYKERYPYEHRKITGEPVMHKLTDEFYGYRKKVTYDTKQFTYLRPYYNFMKSHIENLAYMGCSHECGVKDDIVKNQLHYNRHKLKLIDSVVREKELKDNLFRNVAVYYLLKSRDKEENNALFIDEFHQLSGNNRHIEEINDLYEGIRSIQPNKELPNLKVKNVEGETVSLYDIAKGKKAVFYFWSATYKKHYKDITNRVSVLSKENPQYTFVGISTASDEVTWKGLLARENLDENLQFWSNDGITLKRTLIIDHPNKCIITEDAKIVDAFSDMYASF